MLRILATSIVAAIPAVLPVHAVDAFAKPVPQPVWGHFRHAPARAHTHAHARHAIHRRPAYAPVGETRGGPARGPENDVKVDADDGGGQGDAQGASEAPAGPERGAAGAQGAVGAPGMPSARGAHKAVRNRPSRTMRTRPGRRPASRPGTGADSGFADADDPALPPEAAAAIREAAELQDSAQKAAGPGRTAPGTTKPDTTPGTTSNTTPGTTSNTTPGTTPVTTPGTRPGATVPQGAAPAAPQGTGRGRPANQTTDRSTNQTSNREAGRPSSPVVYFNAVPAARGSRLVLQTSAGNSPERTVTLQCDPPGGTHPKAAAACADVSKADGDLAQMPANRQAAGVLHDLRPGHRHGAGFLARPARPVHQEVPELLRDARQDRFGLRLLIAGRRGFRRISPARGGRRAHVG